MYVWKLWHDWGCYWIGASRKVTNIIEGFEKRANIIKDDGWGMRIVKNVWKSRGCCKRSSSVPEKLRKLSRKREKITWIIKVAGKGNNIIECLQKGTNSIKYAVKGTNIIEASRKGTNIIDGFGKSANIIMDAGKWTNIIKGGRRGRKIIENTENLWILSRLPERYEHYRE